MWESSTLLSWLRGWVGAGQWVSFGVKSQLCHCDLLCPPCRLVLLCNLGKRLIPQLGGRQAGMEAGPLWPVSCFPGSGQGPSPLPTWHPVWHCKVLRKCAEVVFCVSLGSS